MPKYEDEDASEEEEERAETTRGEKILASAMVVFLLIGGVQILNELKEIPSQPQNDLYYQKHGVYKLKAEGDSISAELRTARETLTDVEKEFSSAKEKYLFKREEYRVILDKGGEDAVKEREWEEARARYNESQERLEAAQAVYDEVRGRLDEKQGELHKARELAREEYDRAYQKYRLKVLAVRLAFVLPLLAVAIFVFLRAKKARSKYLLHANAFLAFASLLLIFMIVENVWKFVHVLGISILGAVACAITLAYLKKQLFSFERVSRSRLREGKCPWCGFPLRSGAGGVAALFCQNCGRRLLEECSECGELRPILAKFCPNCGGGESKKKRRSEKNETQ